MSDLGKRAIVSKHWRWMDGARGVVPKNLPAAWGGHTRACRVPHTIHSTMVPDLTDPATIGCLMHLVREAWGGKVVIRWGNGWWEVETDSFYIDHETTDSYEAALVAALEAAE